jgi:SAM-dependent methyltransferase
MHTMKTIESMLTRAQEIAAAQPAEAAQLFASVLALDHTNLTAHNALERMHTPDCYGRWMRVNCVIDPRDDIFRFFANYQTPKNPIREYLADGWRTMSELMLLLEAVDRPLLKMQSMLEFAAGFGRFTRHLAKALPGRLTCSDVMPGSVEFLREQFGVEGVESSHDPEKLVLPKQYELVFVLSMFTHLPPRMWAPWLHALKRTVQPGGLLVFSVHNETYAKELGVAFGTDGTHFISSSESPSIDAETYGTTFTTRRFVEDSVSDVFGAKPQHYQSQCFWIGHDAVVVCL